MLFIAGDRAGWASHCIGHYAVDDVQTLLEWTAVVWGWRCSPGAIDNDLGAQTQAALAEFRREYNLAWNASLPKESPVSEADFAAFFDVCDLTLQDMLDPELPNLADQRKALQVHAVLAAGEDWPRSELTIANYPTGTDRRVDLVFLEEDQLHLADGDDPPAAELYGSGRVTAQPLGVDPVPFASTWISFELADAEGEPMANERYEIRDGAGTMLSSGNLDAAGRVRVNRIPFVSCRIVFPDLGDEAWGELA
jgi:hypothetical protein